MRLPLQHACYDLADFLFYQFLSGTRLGEKVCLMDAAIPSARRYYRPELDAVRFLAFLLVFLFHILPSNNDLRVNHLLRGFAPLFYYSAIACGYGLTLFFTLSAFLICELLLRERQNAGTVDVKQFYIRRILRIWPLYYLALSLSLVVSFLPGGPPGEIVRIGWFSIFMGAWYSAFHASVFTPLSPLWSISVEEQFYLLVPWVVKYASRGLLYGFCACIALVANITLYHLGAVSAAGDGIWYNSFVQFECFAAGILLCLVLRGQVPRFAIWQRLVLIAGCYFCWLFAAYELHPRLVETSENPGSWPLILGYALAALGSILLLVAFMGVSPKLLPGWTIYLGRISFGLYVYHGFGLRIMHFLPLGRLNLIAIPSYPLRVFVTAGLTLGLPLALTFLMAALSYRYFETPFLKMKKRHEVIDSQPIQGPV
jgi:peptidoglycan/LPS O-acetylase OafA/YrhL